MWFFLGINEPLRCDEDFRERKQPGHHNKMQQLALEKIDFGCVSQTPGDYMHCVLLGVMGQTLKCCLKVKKEPFSLTKFQIQEIDYRFQLNKINICKEFSRKPRSTYEVDRWKATEFRLFLCYTGILALKDIMPKIL